MTRRAGRPSPHVPVRHGPPRRLAAGHRARVRRLRERVAAHLATDFYVPIVSFHEQCQGWNAYVSRARETEGVVHGYNMFQQLLEDFAAAQVVPFDTSAATRFDALRGERVRVPTMDLRIASIALSRDMTLLSRNLRDFQKVPG